MDEIIVCVRVCTCVFSKGVGEKENSLFPLSIRGARYFVHVVTSADLKICKAG